MLHIMLVFLKKVNVFFPLRPFQSDYTNSMLKFYFLQNSFQLVDLKAILKYIPIIF